MKKNSIPERKQIFYTCTPYNNNFFPSTRKFLEQWQKFFLENKKTSTNKNQLISTHFVILHTKTS